MSNLQILRRLCERLPTLAEVELEADRRVRDRTEQVQDHNRIELEGSLARFVAAAWPSFDPSPYHPCWAIEALCEHLQAVTEGQIKNLLVNFPPRCAKTSVTSICYPAWVWAQRSLTYRTGPRVRFLCGSYNHDLALTNSTMTRRLILSPWYQSLWGDRFELRVDQNTKTKFDTTSGGTRIATSVGGSLLGIGGDIIIIDDPHNTESVESEAEREAALKWWKEISTTRLNDPKQSPLVVIMQRLHEEDVSGHILASDWSDEWCHLMIPMQYESQRHCVTSIGWQDPRGLDEDGEQLDAHDAEERDGELMWPERFGEREIQRMKTELGPYMASGRLQQMPVPDRGGIFDRTWWERYDHPQGQLPVFDYVLASLDGAFTEKEENDPSALTVWGVWSEDGNRRIMLMRAWRKHLKFSGERRLVEPLPSGPFRLRQDDGSVRFNPNWIKWQRETQEHWGLMEWLYFQCTEARAHKLIIEAKGPGISAAQELQNRFGAIFSATAVQTVPVKGDKVARALAVQPMFAKGQIYAPLRDYAQMVIDEMAVFPKGKYDDLTDSATQALSYLRDVGLAQTDHEIKSATEEGVMHRARQKLSVYAI